MMKVQDEESDDTLLKVLRLGDYLALDCRILPGHDFDRDLLDIGFNRRTRSLLVASFGQRFRLHEEITA